MSSSVLSDVTETLFYTIVSTLQGPVLLRRESTVKLPYILKSGRLRICAKATGGNCLFKSASIH